MRGLSSLPHVPLVWSDRDRLWAKPATARTDDAYLLTLSSFILLGGSLGDIFGERRVFALGVGGFGATSVLCAIAPSIGTLIAFRALQGIAGRC